MNSLTKKIVAIVTTVTCAAWMISPGVASAATAEELLASIQTLQDQLNTLMAQYSTLTGTTVAAGTPAACAGVTFTANLTIGSTGAAVQCLQAFLNTSATTQVAATGAGSPGSETTYFGSLTQAAVSKFQANNAISPTAGFVGPITRAKLNELLAAGTTTPTTTLPAGCTSTTGYSPTTGVSCATGETTTPAGPAAEGTLSITAAATPADAQNIYVGQIDKEIAGLTVKALGSDIQLSRLDINFTTRPWLNISTITITDGTTVVAFDVTEANTVEVTAGSSYLIRVTGLNITVPNNTTKTLTIKITPKLVVGGTTATLTYNIPANGLRGTDGIGIVQYAPSTLLTARTVVVATASGAMTLSTTADNPVERAVIGKATAITEDVEMLRFNVKATINDVIISQIYTGTVTDTNDAIQTLKLYDGATLLAATSTPVGSANVFGPLNLRVSKDTTKTLSIKADMNIVTVARTGASTSVSVATAGIVSADAGTFAAVTAGGSTATGKKIHLYTAAPSLALVSVSNTTVARGGELASNTPVEAIAKIKFNVTAVGGDIYLGSTTGTGITAVAVLAASTTVASTYDSNASVESTSWLVRESETKWFEVTSDLVNASSVARYVYLSITNIKWGTSTQSGVSNDWDWDSIPLEFKTTPVYLKAWN